MFNDVEYQHLVVADVEIQNDSRHDLKNLQVEIVSTGGGMILGAGRWVTTQWLPWHPVFASHLAVVRQEPPPDGALLDASWAYLTVRRGVVIPILNRRETIKAILLLEVPSGTSPALHVICHHAGAVVEHRPKPPLFMGVPLVQAAAVGFLAAVLGSTVTGWLAPGSMNAAFTGMALGSCGQLMGAGIIHTKRFVARLFH